MNEKITIQDLSYWKEEYIRNKVETKSLSSEQRQEVEELVHEEREETLKNFRRPIDYDFWGKRPRWTLMETALLISNICPKDIAYKKWRDIKNYLKQSEAEQYLRSEKSLILIDDYYGCKYLKSYHKQVKSYWDHEILEIAFSPFDIIEWVEKFDIEAPKELINVVKDTFNKEKNNSISWQENYKQLQDKVKILEEKLANTHKKKLTLEELAETENILNTQTQRSCDNVIANIVVALIKNKNEFNSSHIDTVLNEKIPLERIEELKKHGFKIVDRKTLTKYLKKPRTLIGLKETAMINKAKM